MIFVSWAFVYCLFLLIVLGIALARPTASGDSNSLDGQQVGLAAVAGFFALFTSGPSYAPLLDGVSRELIRTVGTGMSSTHTYLLMYNMTTIEHMGLSRMKEREQASLDRAFGTFELLDKRRTVLRWNREWGAPMTEGNPFWLGTATNWRSVMGESRLGWFRASRLVFPVAAQVDSSWLHSTALARQERARRDRLPAQPAIHLGRSLAETRVLAGRVPMIPSRSVVWCRICPVGSSHLAIVFV